MSTWHLYTSNIFIFFVPVAGVAEKQNQNKKILKKQKEVEQWVHTTNCVFTLQTFFCDP